MRISPATPALKAESTNSTMGDVMRDYRAWHDEYDRPGSSLAKRLTIVQRRLAEVLSGARPGPVRLVSMCAGQGRDVLGVLPTHPRRDDVSGTLVEVDPRNVAVARREATAAGLDRLSVLEADAAISDTYRDVVPADVLVACGIFGNISDADIENSVRHLSRLCARRASVIWTRNRREPDVTPRIRRWFAESAFEECSFDAVDNETLSGVGVARLAEEPLGFKEGLRFFTFIR